MASLRFDMANHLGVAREGPLIALSGPSAKSATHLRCRGLVDSVCSRSLAGATVYGYTFLLAIPELATGSHFPARGIGPNCGRRA